jgi:hypothetical protein
MARRSAGVTGKEFGRPVANATVCAGRQAYWQESKRRSVLVSNAADST